MRFAKLLIITLILSFSFSPLMADDYSCKFRSELSGTYALGAQVYNSNFLSRPGLSFNYAHSYKLNRNLNCGLGGGYMQLEDEQFIPIYANLLAFTSTKDEIEKYVRCNIGYAFASSKAMDMMDNYDMRGGMFLRFGYGHAFPVNGSLAISTEFSYLYQNAKLDYKAPYSTSSTEMLNYSFLQLTLGFVINYCQ